jgi:hypothetical protein
LWRVANASRETLCANGDIRWVLASQPDIKATFPVRLNGS